MQLANLLTLLMSASTALTAALPASEDTSLTARGKPTLYVEYCANPTTCAKLQVKKEACQTFAEGFPDLTFDEGLKCNVYLNPSCTKQFFVSAGKVSKVTGHFNVNTDPRAIKNKVSSVSSFTCF